MRRSVWVLAMCGVAGFSLPSADAQERFGASSSNNPGSTQAPQQSSRFFSAGSGTAPAPTPGAEAEKAPTRFVRVKAEAAQPVAEPPKPANYYGELFGGTAAAPVPAPAPAPAASAETAPQPPAKTFQLIPAPNRFAGKPDVAEPVAVPAETAPAEATPAPAVAAPKRDFSEVMQAQFEAAPEAARFGEIQPVRADAIPPGGNRFAPRPPAQTAPQPADSENNPFAPKPPAADNPPSNITITRSRNTPQPAPPAVTTEAISAPQSTAVTLEWVKQGEINVGQECRCQLLVKNTSQSNVRDLEVEAYFPRNMRVLRAAPEAVPTSDSLTWRVGEIAAGETRQLEVVFTPLERGQLSTRADVRFSTSVAGAFTVAEPLLKVTVDGPQQVMVGEPASQTVHISNPGTGVASNVQIEALIPEGLEHARGKRLQMNLGSLNPGETRPVRLALAAVQGGRHALQVQVRGEGGLLQTTGTEVLVIAPKLVAGIEGPGLRYVGRPGTFTLRVLNDGAAPTNNVKVMHKIPEGMAFVSADRGAQYDPATGLLNWFVGKLEPEQSAEIRVTLNASRIGEHEHFVRATCEHGAISDTQMTTTVEGASALAVEVRDLDDPVEVGREAIYEVKIKNDGSAPARSVGLACELAPGMTFISAEGPSDFIAEEGVVIFRALPELDAAKSATFRVKVAVAAPGTLRFRARLSSESVTEPLTTEELTKFYGER